MNESIIARQLKALAEFTDPGAIGVSVSHMPVISPAPETSPVIPKESPEEEIQYRGVIEAIKANQDEFAKLIDEISSLKDAAREDKDGTKTSELHSKLKLVDEKFAGLEELYKRYKALHGETKSVVSAEPMMVS